MPILNYTTTIKADKTAAEIQAMLAKSGAKHVAISYGGGRPVEMTFTVATEWGEQSYRLPANADGVYAALCKARGVAPRLRTMEQAEQVAWRILKDWVEAQLAIIEARMVRLEEVMLPYMLVAPDRTVAMDYRDRQMLAIEAAL